MMQMFFDMNLNARAKQKLTCELAPRAIYKTVFLPSMLEFPIQFPIQNALN